MKDNILAHTRELQEELGMSLEDAHKLALKERQDFLNAGGIFEKDEATENWRKARQLASQICPNAEYGEHIRVRCRGCGSLHSTKNIGGRSADGVAFLDRHLFDVTKCTCEDPLKEPVTHICERDDMATLNTYDTTK